MPSAKSVAEKIVRARVSPGLTGVDGRPIAVPNPAAKLKAIFQEIDETLLPRKLSFAIGEGRAVHMDVGTRRLYRLVGVEIDRDTSALQLAFASRDQDNLKAQVAEIAQLLVSFVRQPGAMTVLSKVTSKTYRASEVGFNSQELAAASALIGVPDQPDAVADAVVEGEAEALAEPEIDTSETVPEAPSLETAEALDEMDEDLAAPAPDSSEVVEQRLLDLLAEATKGELAKVPAKTSAAAAPPPPATIEEYFEACKSCATNGVLLAADGAVLAVFGRGVQENWLDIAGHAADDFSAWIEVAGWALGPTQLLVLKGTHFEDSSIAVLFKDGKYAAITMRNLDLNKVMKLGMEVLAQQGAKG